MFTQRQTTNPESVQERNQETPRPKRVTNFSVESLLDLNVTSPTDSGYSSSASPNPHEVPSKSRNVSGDSKRSLFDHHQNMSSLTDSSWKINKMKAERHCSSPDSALGDCTSIRTSPSSVAGSETSESVRSIESLNFFQSYQNLNMFSKQAQLCTPAPLIPFSPADMYWMQLGRIYWEQALLKSGFPGYQSPFATAMAQPTKYEEKIESKTENGSKNLPKGRFS